MTRSTRTTSKKATSRTDGRQLAAALVAVAIALVAARAGGADQTPSQVVDGLANQVVPILQDKSAQLGRRSARSIEQIAYTAMDFDTLVEAGAGAELVEILPRATDRVRPGVQAATSRSPTAATSTTTTTRRCRSSASARRRAATSSCRRRSCAAAAARTCWSTIACAGSDGQWKIIDVVVEGVSLVSNFRSQFQDIVATGGPDKLLALLKEKNISGEPLSSRRRRPAA